jgi:CheY-like chemotaxis protein
MVAARQLRILVAEDDEEIVRLYRDYALRRGHNVLHTHDGPETLVMAAGELPDVVILDIGMPKLDGRDVLRQLKQSPKTAGIPIVVVSARAGDQNMRDLLLELGAADVIEKPADLALTFSRLERLADRAAHPRP